MIIELDELELDAECPTCGWIGGGGYLAIACREGAEPCPNCNPRSVKWKPLTFDQRSREFDAWAERN